MVRFAFVLAAALTIASTCFADDWSDYERAGRSFRLALFDLPPAEDVASSGGAAVRVFVDGAFTGPLPALVLDRAPDGRGRLTVKSSRRDGKRWVRAAWSANLSNAAYAQLFDEATQLAQQAAAASQEADRAAADPKPASVTDIVVCTDGAVTVIEVAADGHVDRGSEGNCADRGLQEFAMRLAQQAVNLSPDCHALSGKGAYGAFSQLRLCALASGDRTAAVQVMNLIDEGQRVPSAFADAASSSMVFAWPGRNPTVGAAIFRARWAELIATLSAHFVMSDVRGVGPDRVVVNGEVHYLAHPEDELYQGAPSSQTWERQAGRWRLTRWTVGRFAPFRPTHDPRVPT